MNGDEDLTEAALDIIRCASEKGAPREQLAEFKRRIAELRGANSNAIKTLVTWQEAAMAGAEYYKGNERRDRRGLSIAGGIFLVALLVIAVLIPNPTDFQERIFVVVLAISGGFAVAFLPGAIAVEGRWAQNNYVRAAGAVGFVVLVLLIYRWLL